VFAMSFSDLCLYRCYPSIIIILSWFFLALIINFFSTSLEVLYGKSVSNMTCLVSSWTLNWTQSINQENSGRL